MQLRTNNTPKGIALIVASTFCFAIMNVIMKWLAGKYLATEITFFRQAFGIIPIIVMIGAGGGRKLLKTKRPGGHFLRAFLGNATLMLLVYSYTLLPLADVSALFYTQSLFLTAMAGPILHEKVGPYRWSAVVCGLIGAIIILNPTGAMNFGAAIALLGGFISGITLVVLRQLTRSEAPLTIVFYFTLFGAIFIGFVALPTLQLPFGFDLALMALMGMSGGLAQYFQTAAYRYAEATVIAPYNYVALLWIILFQFAIWHDLPAPRTAVGATLIIGSGIYILYRERKKKSEVVTAVPLSESID